MAATAQSIDQTAEFVIKRRPVLATLLHAFQPLFETREAAALELAPILASKKIGLPPFVPNNPGKPMLESVDFAGYGELIGNAAARMLPELLKQEKLAPYKEALETFFLNKLDKEELDLREKLAQAVFQDSPESFMEIAKTSRIPPEILDFTSEFILSTVLRALTTQTLHGLEEAPWDGEGVWQFGYCPVCGSAPSIGWLDMRSFDEKNAFLSGGGGKKHLHCAMCGANWKIRRGVCPACGKEGEGVMNILKESGTYGERLDWCGKCQIYCPTVDLRELEKIPNMDIMALGMIHMDMAAADRNLKPLRASFWNVF